MFTLWGTTICNILGLKVCANFIVYTLKAIRNTWSSKQKKYIYILVRYIHGYVCMPSPFKQTWDCPENFVIHSGWVYTHIRPCIKETYNIQAMHNGAWPPTSNQLILDLAKRWPKYKAIYSLQNFLIRN